MSLSPPLVIISNHLLHPFSNQKASRAKPSEKARLVGLYKAGNAAYCCATGSGTTAWSITRLSPEDPFQVQSEAGIQIALKGHAAGLRVCEADSIWLPSQPPDGQAGRGVLRNGSETLDRAGCIAPAHLFRPPAALTRVPSATAPRHTLHAVHPAPARPLINDASVLSSGTTAATRSLLLCPHYRPSGKRRNASSCVRRGTTPTNIKAVPGCEAPGAQPIARLLACQAQPSEQDPHAR